MFRGMPQNFPMQRSVGAPTMGGMQSIQPLQPPTPPPRQDNLMNFTRMLGGGNFNNPNFRAQPLPQYQGPQVPTAPPRAPQQGGIFNRPYLGAAAERGLIERPPNPNQRVQPQPALLPNRAFPMQQPQVPPQSDGQVTNQLPLRQEFARAPQQGGGFATTGQEFFRNQPGQRLPMQPPQMQQPPMPPQGGGQITTGREFLRNQPVMPGVRSSLGVGSGQLPQMPQPQVPPQGGGQVFQGGGGGPMGGQAFRGGQPFTSPGLTVLPPRFGDSAPPMQGPRPGGPFMPTGPMDEMTRRRVESGEQFKYGAPSTGTGTTTTAMNGGQTFAQNGGTPPPSGSAGTGTTTTGTDTTTTTGTGTTPTTTTDTGTTPTTGTASGEQPFVTSVDKTETRMDPITQQLLFGLDGQGGFIPGAFEAAERTFFDAQGRPIVVPQEIAGLSPDQLRAAQLARSQVGVQRPFIEEAMGLGRQGLGSLERGLTDQAIFDKEALQEMRRGADFALDQRDLGLMDALGGIAEGRGRAIGAEARLRGDLADQERFQTGATDRYLQQLGQREGLARSAADQFGMDLARTRQQGRRTFDEFGRDVTDALGMRAMAGEGLDRDLARSELMATLGTDRQRRGLGRAEGTLMRGIGGLDTGISEAEGLTRRSTRGFDPSMTEQFFDPFEDRVVQQTIEDISEQATKGDIAQRARDIASGGQSAFGSRAKLAAGERAEALGRGLAKEIGALRSRGFGQAQQSALGEFARQRAAESAAASGLSSLAGQRFGGRQALSGARERRSQQELAASRGLSDILSRGATQRFGAGSGFADAASQAAAQKLGAGTAFGDLIGRTAAQQLGAQQQLGQTLGQTGASGFGALSGLGSLIGSGAQQRFAAGTGLGQTLAGLGQASAGARQQAGSTGMGISSNLANLFRGIGGTQAQGGAQLGSAQAGFGSQLAGLGSQLQQAGTSDIGLLQGMGAQAQAQRQRELDAQRAMLLQAQQAPLAQYQALMPFVGMAPTGQTTFRTQFGTPPSALQAGLGVGLSGLGAIGNFYNRDRTKD